MALTADQYVGSPDFRGYIAKVAPEFLGYVGSDSDFANGGGINTAKLNSAGGVESNYANQSLNVQGATNTIQQLYKQYQQASATPLYNPANLTAGYSAPAQAANFDVAGTFANAYTQAQANQNPLYQKYLDQFLQQQADQTAAQQHTYDTTNTALDTTLQNTLDANQTAGERATEDTATNEDNINTQADQFQTDSGTAATGDRLALAKANSAAGLTGGLGAQKLETQQATRDTTEARQDATFQQQKDVQELGKARTFEDLATSSNQAQQTNTTGKANNQFDLDSYLKLASDATDQYKTQNAAAEQQAILDDQKQIASNDFQTYLTGLSDPVRVATAAKYNGAFS